MTQDKPSIKELMECGDMSFSEAHRFLLAENLAERARLTFGPYFADETQPWNIFGMKDVWLAVFEYRVAGARTIRTWLPIKTAQYEDFKATPSVLDFVANVSRSTVASTLRENCYIVGPKGKLPN